MKKLFIFLIVWVAGFLILVGATKIAAADNYMVNQIRAESLLVEQGYSIDEAREDLQFMTIANEGELVGIDVFAQSELDNVNSFRATALTTTQCLSHNAVRQICSNLNAIDKGSYILGILIGFKNPVFGAVIRAGGFQNPNFRSTITKAYYQEKRVKIVTEYGASMSLNKIYYYIMDLEKEERTMFWKKFLPSALITVIFAVLYYQTTSDPWFLYVMIPLFLLGSLVAYWLTKRKNGN